MVDEFELESQEEELDADLWLKWKQGCEEAGRKLLDRYAELVWSVCKRVLFRSTDSEDAFQIVFLMLFRNGGSIRGQAFGPWVRKVAFHAALQIRDENIRLRVTDDFEMDTLGSTDHALKDIEQVERNLVLESALNSLPEHMYELIVQFHFEGLSRAEISKLHEITESKVKSRLQQARQRLREFLTRKGLGAGALMVILGLPEFAKAAPPAELIDSIESQIDSFGESEFCTNQLNQVEILERKLNMTGNSFGILKGVGIAVATAIAVSLLSVLINPTKTSVAGADDNFVSVNRSQPANQPSIPTLNSKPIVVGFSSNQQTPVSVSTNSFSQEVQNSPSDHTTRSVEDSGEHGLADIDGVWVNSARNLTLKINSKKNFVKFTMSRYAGMPYGMSAVGEFSQIGDSLVGIIVSCHIESESQNPEELEAILQANMMLGSLAGQAFAFQIAADDSSVYIGNLRVSLPAVYGDEIDIAGSSMYRAMFTGEFKKSK